MHRFYINSTLNEKTGFIQEKGLVHQIKNVLKLKNGEEILLFNGKNHGARVRLDEIEGKNLGYTMLSWENGKPPAKSITLAASLIKRDNFEWIAQKATEVGVARIIPVISERSVKLGFNSPRMQKIIIEAAEQSGRFDLPVLEEPKKLEDVFKIDGEKFFIDFSEEQFSGKEIVGGSAVVLVGPEGGWSERERELAFQNGCKVRSLGPLVLRAETAAVVASYLAIN